MIQQEQRLITDSESRYVHLRAALAYKQQQQQRQKVEREKFAQKDMKGGPDINSGEHSSTTCPSSSVSHPAGGTSLYYSALRARLLLAQQAAVNEKKTSACSTQAATAAEGQVAIENGTQGRDLGFRAVSRPAATAAAATVCIPKENPLFKTRRSHSDAEAALPIVLPPPSIMWPLPAHAQRIAERQERERLCTVRREQRQRRGKALVKPENAFGEIAARFLSAATRSGSTFFATTTSTAQAEAVGHSSPSREAAPAAVGVLATSVPHIKALGKLLTPNSKYLPFNPITSVTASQQDGAASSGEAGDGAEDVVNVASGKSSPFLVRGHDRPWRQHTQQQQQTQDEHQLTNSGMRKRFTEDIDAPCILLSSSLPGSLSSTSLGSSAASSAWSPSSASSSAFSASGSGSSRTRSIEHAFSSDATTSREGDSIERGHSSEAPHRASAHGAYTPLPSPSPRPRSNGGETHRHHRSHKLNLSVSSGKRRSPIASTQQSLLFELEAIAKGRAAPYQSYLFSPNVRVVDLTALHMRLAKSSSSNNTSSRSPTAASMTMAAAAAGKTRGNFLAGVVSPQNDSGAAIPAHPLHCQSTEKIGPQRTVVPVSAHMGSSFAHMPSSTEALQCAPRPEMPSRGTSSCVSNATTTTASLADSSSGSREELASGSDLSYSKAAPNTTATHLGVPLTYQEQQQQHYHMESALTQFTSTDDGATCVCFSPAGDCYAIGTASGALWLNVLACDEGITEATYLGTVCHLKAPHTVSTSPPRATTGVARKGIDADSSHDDRAQHQQQQYRKEKMVRLHGHSGSISFVSFSDDGSMFASAAVDRSVILWKTATRSKLRRMQVNLSATPPLSIHFMPYNNNYLIVAFVHDKHLQLYNSSTGLPVGSNSRSSGEGRNNSRGGPVKDSVSAASTSSSIESYTSTVRSSSSSVLPAAPSANPICAVTVDPRAAPFFFTGDVHGGLTMWTHRTGEAILPTFSVAAATATQASLLSSAALGTFPSRELPQLRRVAAVSLAAMLPSWATEPAAAKAGAVRVGSLQVSVMTAPQVLQLYKQHTEQLKTQQQHSSSTATSTSASQATGSDSFSAFANKLTSTFTGYFASSTATPTCAGAGATAAPTSTREAAPTRRGGEGSSNISGSRTKHNLSSDGTPPHVASSSSSPLFGAHKVQKHAVVDSFCPLIIATTFPCDTVVLVGIRIELGGGGGRPSTAGVTVRRFGARPNSSASPHGSSTVPDTHHGTRQSSSRYLLTPLLAISGVCRVRHVGAGGIMCPDNLRLAVLACPCEEGFVHVFSSAAAAAAAAARAPVIDGQNRGREPKKNPHVLATLVVPCGGRCRGLAWSPDGRFLVAVTTGGMVYQWERVYLIGTAQHTQLQQQRIGSAATGARPSFTKVAAPSSSSEAADKAGEEEEENGGCPRIADPLLPDPMDALLIEEEEQWRRRLWQARQDCHDEEDMSLTLESECSSRSQSMRSGK